MFLTRLGFGSQVVVTGDVTQVDLPAGQLSGLRVVQGILDGIEDIHFARLTSHDVVRHRLVGKIVDAYERYDAQERRQLGRNGTAAQAERQLRRGRADEHRYRQRVRCRRGRGRARRRGPVHPGPDADPPAGRAVRAAGGRADHDRAARALDGRAGPDRRPGLPDGRTPPAAPGRQPRRRPRARRRTGSARRRGAVPAGRRGASGKGWSLRPGRARAAYRARDLAPARLRPRRARGARRHVRHPRPTAQGLASNQGDTETKEREGTA